MGQIFKNPKDLIVKIGEDILINRKSIKKDIEAFKSDFGTAKWEQSGKDLGEALALVLFGKQSSTDEESDTESETMPETEYNAYLILSGYAYLH